MICVKYNWAIVSIINSNANITISRFKIVHKFLFKVYNKLIINTTGHIFWGINNIEDVNRKIGRDILSRPIFLFNNSFFFLQLMKLFTHKECNKNPNSNNS